MANTIRGEGTLISDEGVKYAVRFEFEGIPTTWGVPGLPPQSEELSYSGRVERLDNAPLERGHYELHAADGAKYHVENLGTLWSVLGSVSSVRS